MRAVEPLGSCLDAPRWHATLLCLLAMMDQVCGLYSALARTGYSMQAERFVQLPLSPVS